MNIAYTMGYEGTDIDKFVASLQAAGVNMLADVRAIALSRKKGFSKTALRSRLEAEGIAYIHFVELGDPKAGRDAARAGKFDEFRRIYSMHLDSAKAIGALRVLEEAALTNSVCLLCFERDPRNCHRTIVADRLKTRGIEVFDIYGDDPSRYVRHSSKFARRDACQSDAQSQPEIR
jgi:uncharacterized protein (DUF488 family)